MAKTCKQDLGKHIKIMLDSLTHWTREQNFGYCFPF